MERPVKCGDLAFGFLEASLKFPFERRSLSLIELLLFESDPVNIRESRNEALAFFGSDHQGFHRPIRLQGKDFDRSRRLGRIQRRIHDTLKDRVEICRRVKDAIHPRNALFKDIPIAGETNPVWRSGNSCELKDLPFRSRHDVATQVAQEPAVRQKKDQRFSSVTGDVSGLLCLESLS